MDVSLRKNKADLSMVNVTAQRHNTNLKLNELTMAEIQGKGGEQLLHGHVWKGVGKAFMRVDSKKYVEELKKENATTKDDLRALDIKKNYIETSLNNTVNGMEKIFGKQKSPA